MRLKKLRSLYLNAVFINWVMHTHLRTVKIYFLVVFLLGSIFPLHIKAQTHYKAGTDTLMAGVRIKMDFKGVCKNQIPYLGVTIQMKNQNNLDVIITNPLFKPGRCLKFIKKTLNGKEINFDYQSSAFYCGKSIGHYNNSYPYIADSLFVEGEKHVNTPLLRGYSQMENIILMEGDEMIFYFTLPLVMPGMYSFQYDFMFDVETSPNPQRLRTEEINFSTW